jgi:hypothetical protein
MPPRFDGKKGASEPLEPSPEVLAASVRSRPGVLRRGERDHGAPRQSLTGALEAAKRLKSLPFYKSLGILELELLEEEDPIGKLLDPLLLEADPRRELVDPSLVGEDPMPKLLDPLLLEDDPLLLEADPRRDLVDPLPVGLDPLLEQEDA